MNAVEALQLSKQLNVTASRLFNPEGHTSARVAEARRTTASALHTAADRLETMARELSFETFKASVEELV